ncbi:tubulin polyglutamylase TTLL6 isoform X2 [Anoplophora glabripennis]|uniref:tubulin polyglutamylase TTLL6 isoform X2 n=1 Tax=Anoplophora glabripennis TaxID=217634 RepID=UPI0008751BEA|nr:tubulin polyglutamylase TTLL6 isoform X2 [Anoplophora glabripennis]
MNEENKRKTESNAEVTDPSQNKLVKNGVIQCFIHSYEKYNALSVLIAVVSVITIVIIAADECRQCFIKLKSEPQSNKETHLKKFWVYGKNIQTGYLKEVFTILERLGYENNPNATEWDLLWAHEYPFRKLHSQLNNLKPHQKVNHFPGCGYITNKVDLATSGLKYIPPAFKLPVDKEKFLEYSSKYSNISFVQKNNDHRNIQIRKISDIDLDKEGTFLQEYVDKPLLVSGHRFDIGIYTVITSVDPLRVYIYNGDAILSMKESLNAFLRAQGRNPDVIWEQIEDAIGSVILARESLIVDTLRRFKSKRNFFEMMRMDFIIDENLNIYLLEANMSPNLSSAHFPPNKLIYHQVLYNVLGLVGVAEYISKNSLKTRSKSEEEMIVSDKNIATFSKMCNSNLCRTSCVSLECQLCKPCLSSETRQYLVQAYKEHLHIGDCKRVFPPSMDQKEAFESINLDKFSPENQLQYRWFQGKCQLDQSWC